MAVFTGISRQPTLHYKFFLENHPLGDCSTHSVEPFKNYYDTQRSAVV